MGGLLSSKIKQKRGVYFITFFERILLHKRFFYKGILSQQVLCEIALLFIMSYIYFFLTAMQLLNSQLFQNYFMKKVNFLGPIPMFMYGLFFSCSLRLDSWKGAAPWKSRSLFSCNLYLYPAPVPGACFGRFFVIGNHVHPHTQKNIYI